MFQIVVHDKEGRRTVRAFDQPRVTIGRGEENDVVLADASVSKRHAVVERAEGAFTIQDLGSTNGVFLEGERIEREAAVPLGPNVDIGVGDFKVALAVLDEEPAQTFRIGVTEPGGRHHVFAVRGDEVTVGADPGCDLQLEGEGMGPRHARVVIQSDRLVLADLRSAAGTWLNDERLTAPQVVHEGDVVRVGCFSLSFARPGRPGPLRAPAVAAAGEDRTLPTAEPDETPASSSPAGGQHAGDADPPLDEG